MGFYKKGVNYGNNPAIAPPGKTKLQLLKEELDALEYAINGVQGKLVKEFNGNDLGRLNRAAVKNGMAAKYRELKELIAAEKENEKAKEAERKNKMVADRNKAIADQNKIDREADLDQRLAEDAIIDRLIERGPSDTK